MPKPAITRVGNFAVDSNYTQNKYQGLIAPSVTTAQRDAINTSILTSPIVIFNSTIGLYQVRQNGAWYTLNTTVGTTGTGLAANTAPLIVPSGAAADVEVVANQINGFIYYNTTANTLKARVNGAWRTITTA